MACPSDIHNSSFSSRRRTLDTATSTNHVEAQKLSAYGSALNGLQGLILALVFHIFMIFDSKTRMSSRSLERHPKAWVGEAFWRACVPKGVCGGRG